MISDNPIRQSSPPVSFLEVLVVFVSVLVINTVITVPLHRGTALGQGCSGCIEHISRCNCNRIILFPLS